MLDIFNSEGRECTPFSEDCKYMGHGCKINLISSHSQRHSDSRRNVPIGRSSFADFDNLHIAVRRTPEETSQAAAAVSTTDNGRGA